MADNAQKAGQPLSPVGVYYSEPVAHGYSADINRPPQAPIRAMPPPAAYQQPTNAYMAHPPTPAVAQATGVRTGQWDADLCGCFTDVVPNCVMPTFCPCVSLAQITSRLSIMPFGATLSVFACIYAVQWAVSSLVSYRFYYLSLDGEELCDYDWYYDWYYCYYSRHTFGAAYGIFSALSFLAELAVFLAVWHIRNQTRLRFQLPGSGCGDCCMALCCTCCSVAQVATHIKSYKPGSCDFAPVDSLPAYDRNANANANAAVNYA